MVTYFCSTTFSTVSSLREAGEECCCHYCNKINGVLLVTRVVPKCTQSPPPVLLSISCRLLSARSVGCALPGYGIYSRLPRITPYNVGSTPIGVSRMKRHIKAGDYDRVLSGAVHLAMRVVLANSHTGSPIFTSSDGQPGSRVLVECRTTRKFLLQWQ